MPHPLRRHRPPRACSIWSADRTTDERINPADWLIYRRGSHLAADSVRFIPALSLPAASRHLRHTRL